MSTKINLKNQRFGRLVVKCATGYRSGNSIVWLCRCDCGKYTFVSNGNLRGGHTNSCGCLQKELFIEKFTIHNLCRTPEWRSWAHMRYRCYNPNNCAYKNYGGRGIKVCKRWRTSFINFLKDMGRKPSSNLSIDRINNDKGYFPKNCRWATYKEQANNRRERSVYSNYSAGC